MLSKSGPRLPLALQRTSVLPHSTRREIGGERTTTVHSAPLPGGWISWAIHGAIENPVSMEF